MSNLSVSLSVLLTTLTDPELRQLHARGIVIVCTHLPDYLEVRFDADPLDLFGEYAK